MPTHDPFRDAPAAALRGRSAVRLASRSSGRPVRRRGLAPVLVLGSTAGLAGLFAGGCERSPDPGRGADAASRAAADDARVAESSWPEERGFLRDHVQLTFPTGAHPFVKAGEAYFDPTGSWIIFQAVPMPPAGEAPSPHYLMYVAKLARDADGRVTGMGDPILVSTEDSANTCGWFHPTMPGVILFGSTIDAPQASDAPGYSRGTDRYTWQFPPEMEVVTRTVREIVLDQVRDPERRAELLARPDVDAGRPIWRRPGYCAEGSWSNDGRTVLYTAVDSETGDGDLWLHVMETGEQRPMVTVPGYDGGPFFSPDGRYCCYRSDRRGDNLLQIFVSAFEMGDDGIPTGVAVEHQLTDNEHVNWAPYWHPSGDYLVYASSEVSHRNYEVFAIRFDRDHPTRRFDPVRVTHAEGFDGLPVFSPDGALMMWTAQRGRDEANDGRPSSQIWIARVVAERPAGLGG